MNALARDFRFAVRLLGKSPLFTTIVVATLALAIGLNTAVFSALDALLLRPLPGVRHADEIVQLYRKWPEMDYGSNSIPHYYDLRNRTGETFSDVALWTFNPFNVDFDGTPRRVMGSVVSANYFSLLGVVPAKGRFFVPQEDTGRLAHRVAVISYAAWQGMFGGDPLVVNRRAIVNGREYVIIGVTPREFSGIIPVVTPTLWVPLMQLDEANPDSRMLWDRRGANSFNVVARVRSGVGIAQVRERMSALVRQLADEHPDDYRRSGIGVVRQAEAGIHPMFRTAQLGLSAVVMGVVAILLLIACVNVANLFLARARVRAREMAVRISLGASRAALVRQLLIESLLFATLAGAAGLGIAQWAIAIANRITLPFDMDFTAGMSLSPAVLAFTLATSVVTAVLVGIAPALQATHPSLVPALKGEAPAGETRSRARSGLVVAQMAMSIVLLVAAGLFLRNLKAATTVDKGFTSDHLLFADVDPGLQGYTPARTEEFYRVLRERLGARPGIARVAYAWHLPLSLNESDTRVEVPGYTPSDQESMSIQYTGVSDGYFDAMGITVTSGRPITARDDSTAQRVLVVNQQFADKYFRGRDPVGATVRTRGADHTVIGVVPTGKYQRLGEPPTAFMYFSMYQRFQAGAQIVVRTTGDPEAAIPVLRAEVAALDPTLPLANVQSADRQLGIALLPARLVGSVLGVFGLLGLALAAIGIYGVMAYSVTQRTREIGIRMAIGATAHDVVRLVMRQGATLVVIGGGIGLAGAIATSRALSGVLYGGGENDVLTFVTAPLVLTAVAMFATWVPARRAAHADPLVALRQE